MKYLRQYIRQILLEDAFDFAKEAGMLQSSGELDIPDTWAGTRASKGSRRKVKDLFRQHADHQWLKNNITTIHWARDPELLEDLVGRGKDELSAAMTKTGSPVEWHDYGSTGLWIKGHISLAANNMNDIVSGHYRDYGSENVMDWDEDKVTPEKFKQQRASSGINKQPKSIDKFTQYGDLEDTEKNRGIFNTHHSEKFPYVLGPDTWKEPGRFPNEALVDNWKAEGIIVADPDMVERVESAIQKWDKGIEPRLYEKGMIDIAKKFGVPLYDGNFKVIWSPGE